MSDQDFDIRSILKPEALEKTGGRPDSEARHEVVMDTGRLIFISMGVILVCALFFTAGYIIGRKQASDPNAQIQSAERPVDGLQAAVPVGEGAETPTTKTTGTGDGAAAPGEPSSGDDSAQEPVGTYEPQSGASYPPSNTEPELTDSGERKSLDDIMSEMIQKGNTVDAPPVKRSR